MMISLGLAEETAAETANIPCSVNDAVTKAIVNHPRSTVASARTEAAAGRLISARSGLMPQLFLRANTGTGYTDTTFSSSNTGDAALAEEDIIPTDSLANPEDRSLEGRLLRQSVSATLSQRLFDAGSTAKNYDAVSTQLKAQELRELETREQLALEAVFAYIDVLFSRVSYELALENIEDYNEFRNRAQRRAEGGRGSKADVILVDARRASAESSVRSTQIRLENANRSYEEIIGEPPGYLVIPENPGIAPELLGPIDDQTKIANNFSVQAARLDKAAAELSKTAALRSIGTPRLDLQLSTSHSNREIEGDEQPSTESTALFVLSWDFPGGARVGEHRRTAAVVKEARSIVDVLERQTLESIDTALQEYRGLEDRIKILENYVDSIVFTEDAYQKQMELGRRDFLDLLNIRNEEFNARSSLAVERLRIVAVAYRIMASRGKLVETLMKEKNGGIVLP